MKNGYPKPKNKMERVYDEILALKYEITPIKKLFKQFNQILFNNNIKMFIKKGNGYSSTREYNLYETFFKNRIEGEITIICLMNEGIGMSKKNKNK